MLRHRQAGDTLIEVIFAFTVFSLTVVGAMAVMNQGTSTSQRALETTLVRQEIDSQASALRFLHDSYVTAYQSGANSYPTDTPAGQWNTMVTSIKATAATNASTFGSLQTCPTPPTGSFIIDARNALFVPPTEGRLQPAVTFAQAVYDTSGGLLVQSEGLWIEAIRSGTSADSDQSNTGYIDFHIRACWDGPGQSVPMTTGTIVRLYEPRG